MTFTEAKKLLDEIAERTTRNINRADNLAVTAQRVVDDLAAMQAEYTDPVNAILNATPDAQDEAAWSAAKSEATALVGDFIRLQARAAALKTAIDGVA
jgi:hypothetical protein